MALYLGKQQLKINWYKAIYSLNWYSILSTLTETVLLSSDNCVLKDCNGLYLILKEDEA